jgi:hypothetical protein
MCVILVCPAKVRPSADLLRACHEANPHGAGVAWRVDHQRLAYHKGLGLSELRGVLEIPPLEAELVIHFRFASVGAITPGLCHPFPLRRTPGVQLHGAARELLFHNGTWSGYREAVRADDDLTDSMPGKLSVSDTYVIAAIAARDGVDFLNTLPGRFVHFSPKVIRLYGDWQEFAGMQVSNLCFLPRLNQRRGQTTLWPEPAFSASEETDEL